MFQTKTTNQIRDGDIQKETPDNPTNSTSKFASKNDKQIKILNYNIQGLSKKIDALSMEIQNKGIDIVCLTEHFLNADKLKFINIEGYDIMSCFCRSNSIHGGSLIMVKDLDALERKDIIVLSIENEIEVAAIEIKNIHAVVVTLYRPPSGSIAVFADKLNELMFILNNDKTLKNIFIAGDYNIDFSVKSKNTESITDVFKSFNLNITLVSLLESQHIAVH